MLHRLLSYRVFHSLLLLTLIAGLFGCGGSYVNIPPQQGDVASQNPNNASVRELVTKSVRAVIDEAQLQGPIELKAPEATTRLSLAAIADPIDQVTPPDAQTRPTPAATIDIVAVRIRGTAGAVDLRRPRSSDSEVRQLVSASASWAPFSGWTVTRVRTWRGVTDDR